MAGDAVEGVYIAQGHGVFLAELPVEGVHVTQGHGVLLTELQGIQPHFPGNVLHHALGGEVALGDAVPPHGTGGGPVGVDGEGLGVVADLV